MPVSLRSRTVADFRLALRQQVVLDGKTAPEARVVADEKLREYLDYKVLDQPFFSD